MVEHLARVLDELGAEWILWLLIVLSVISVAVVIERLIFLRRNRVPVADLQDKLGAALDRNAEAALDLLAPYSGMEAVVVAAGIRNLHRGAAAVEEIMAGREQVERQRYDRYLSFLGSLGANAPFIGLLGTVIGIMGAFADLQITMARDTGPNRSQAIMGSISEALVATAIGLLVAIPAVVAFNQFKGRVKRAQSDTAALGSILLAHLKSAEAGPSPDTTETAEAPGDHAPANEG